jgi:hypothetical protein
MRQLLIIPALGFTISTFAQSPGRYTAHEWGTFTTLSGSDGVLLPGLHVDEEKLPDFTYSHSDIYKGSGGEKGFATGYQLSNVTVKMETPVIYFYSDEAMDVSVKVNFPKGAVSQWYPQRTSGEKLPASLKLDFANPYNGWIQWDAKVLPAKDNTAFSAPANEVSPIWQAPRETDANRVDVNGQVEKYLFYRGVANFSLPVITRFAGDKLLVENTGDYDIPFVFIIEKKKDFSEPTIWWTGNLAVGKTQYVTPLAPGLSSLSFDGGLAIFQQALADAGLYKKEAAAMLKTWDKSYFRTDGIKVFWIVPESVTNEVLPISLTPNPMSLKRVLVGRSEVMSPQFEEQLKQAFAKDEGAAYYGDRYYYAYKARVDNMNAQPTGVRNGSNIDYQSLFKVYPNPTSREVQVQWMGEECHEWQLSIIDAAGNEFVRGDAQSFCIGDSQFFNVDQMTAGTYFLRIKGNDREFSMPLLKQ